MTEAKFTPGPWRVEADMRTERVGGMHDSDNGYRDYLAGWNIGSDDGEVVGIEGIIPDDAAEANAHLIAAAPDLYAALQMLSDICYGTFAEGGTPHKAAIAALAKARGE